MKWYYVEENEKKGPFEEEIFLELVTKGTITPETLVWNESMSDWKPYSEIKNTSFYSEENKTENRIETSSAPRSICSMCGKSFLQEELISFENRLICAGCKPTFVQQIKENAEISGKTILHYVGFWKRALAFLLDGIILYILSLVVTIPLSLFANYRAVSYSDNPAVMGRSLGVVFAVQMLSLFLTLLIRMTYEVVLTYKYEATLGKMALGIKVVRPDGSHITLGQSFGRFFSKIVSAIVLYIGFIMAAFSDEKCALHDYMCNTRVIRK